jgi:hypothetical protein
MKKHPNGDGVREAARQGAEQNRDQRLHDFRGHGSVLSVANKPVHREGFSTNRHLALDLEKPRERKNGSRSLTGRQVGAYGLEESGDFTPVRI